MSALAAVVLLVLWMLRPAVSGPEGTPPPRARPPASEPSPEPLKVEVLAIVPHDPESYTQGLLWHAGSLYESGGQYGQSSLRRADLATGEVKQRVEIPGKYFAEGLALVGDKLIQLTWQEKTAFVYRLSDLQKVGEHRYDGAGWGLCFDGRRLVMSNGSDTLTFRDPETFASRGEVRVTRAGVPADRLNELECVDGAVWANVYLTDEILRIDPETGKVTGTVDASGLLTPAERADAEVLNGIAYKPDTKTFLITGKYWPRLFEVRFVPASE
ncbi:MAG TPA: glutaminyl-peptide cyclotransferase [Thermoanaerobaculia bacterium]|nr:glutaminyl-peptide cyclotransferase [Thermoanaerobaculia bacterium]